MRRVAFSALALSSLLLWACVAQQTPAAKEPTSQGTSGPEVRGKDSPKSEPPGTERSPEPEPDRLRLKTVDFAELPGWEDDQLQDALPALGKSCQKLLRKSPDATVGRTPVGGKAKDWQPLCRELAKLGTPDRAGAQAFFEEHFQAYLAHNNDSTEGGFTGYYEASMRGSRRRHGPYQTPLYKRPDDLVMVNMRQFRKNSPIRRIAGKVVRGTLRPYATRKKIREGALRGKGLELVWIDDPVDGFFTQIQGSGIVTLDDGSTMRIGYAAQNGHSYTAIGRELVRDGHMTREEMSMQSIRAWLAEDPERAAEMMDRNEAYVFFVEQKRDGPIGSQNVELTAERSAAVDREFIPQSAPLFIDTMVPTPEGTEMRPFQQLVIAQDSGGAIRGPVRADIFWGASAEGAAVAGRLKSRGRYFVLLPKSVPLPADFQYSDPPSS